MTMRLDILARRIGATLVGDGDVQIAGCAPIDRAGADQIAFLANSRYQRYLESTQAAAVIVDARTVCPERLSRLVVDDPYFAFRNAMIELHGEREHPRPMDVATLLEQDTGAAVSMAASVHATAVIGQGTIIHPHAVVEIGARVGRNCALYPGAYVGPHVRLGDECVLYPNSVVYDGCVLGDRVTLHANTVVGHDGFGYATHDGAHHKIPQAGVVVIEDDVELGAGCAIERAAMGETRIGRGTKFADLISIGHGTKVGKHCLFVSLVGVSGSVEVGDYVSLGGQVGVTGHLRIGNHVQAAGKSAIITDIADGMKVGGVPAIDLDQAKRNFLAGMDLHGLTQRVKKLEKELEKIRKSDQ